jgi:hypothetical protein
MDRRVEQSEESKMIDKLDYALEFRQFVACNPTDVQMVEWNYQRMLMAVNRGDVTNACVYAIELTRWALECNGRRRNWN